LGGFPFFGFDCFAFFSFCLEGVCYCSRFEFSCASFARYGDGLAGGRTPVHRGCYDDTVSAEV